MMNIGKAAAASGVSAKMIRYYESIGLLAAARRTEASATASTPTRTCTCCVSSAARATWPPADIGELLALWRDQGRASADVKGIALAHVAALERKIAELGMADTLRTLAAHCHGDARLDCPILTDLDAGGGR